MEMLHRSDKRMLCVLQASRRPKAVAAQSQLHWLARQHSLPRILGKLIVPACSPTRASMPGPPGQAQHHRSRSSLLPQLWSRPAFASRPRSASPAGMRYLPALCLAHTLLPSTSFSAFTSLSRNFGYIEALWPWNASGRPFNLPG